MCFGWPKLSISLSSPTIHNAPPAGRAPAFVRLSNHIDHVFHHIAPSYRCSNSPNLKYYSPTRNSAFFKYFFCEPPSFFAMAAATRPLGGLVARGPVILSLVYRVFFMLFNLPMLHALPVQFEFSEFTKQNTPLSPDNPTLWIYLAIATGLVVLGGIFAGLTIALMGQVRD